MIRNLSTIAWLGMLVLGCSVKPDAERSKTNNSESGQASGATAAVPAESAPAPITAQKSESARARLSPSTQAPEAGAPPLTADVGSPAPASDVASALEKAGRLRLVTEADSEAFREQLVSVAKDLPAVVAGTGATGLVWNRVVLFSKNRQFDAVRFTSPINEPADMQWMFVTPGMAPTWNILPTTESSPLVGASKTEKDLHLPDTDFPKRNMACFQSFRRGQIQPGHDYILWFAAEDKRPVECQIAIRLVPAGTLKSRFTARAMARDMGLEWPAEPTPHASRVLDYHDDGVAHVRFTPDGRELVSAGNSGKICVWDVTGGTPAANFQTENELLALLELSPDGRIIATSPGTPSEITFWDVGTQAPTGHLHGRNTRCSAMAFSPDGGHLAAWYGAGPNEDQAAGEIVWWGRESLQAELTIPTGNLRGHDLKVTAGGASLFATGSIWQWDNGQPRFISSALYARSIATAERATILEDRYQVLARVLVSGDGTKAATCTNRGLVRLLEGAPLAVVATMHQDGQPNCLAWSPDETLLALGCNDGTLRVWDIPRRTWRSVCKADWRSVASVNFSPDGTCLASAGWDGSVRLWDVSRLGTTLEELLTAEIRDHPALTNSVGMRMVPIPAGSFIRGTPDADIQSAGRRGADERDSERPQRQITITKPFYLAAHEVTVGQFRRFVEATNYVTQAESGGKGGKCYDDHLRRFVQNPDLTWRAPGFEQNDEHPVTQMSWNDANAFCKWLSAEEKAVYRLPTEAEWEHACRAGSRSSGSNFGAYGGGFPESLNIADVMLRRANPSYKVGGNWSDGYAFTAPVGSYLPNAFGLYDMHGNVFEWCQDWFDAFYYARSVTTDPKGPPSGRQRVQRGASFFSHPNDATYASRAFDEPDSAVDNTGFRPVREIP